MKGIPAGVTGQLCKLSGTFGVRRADEGLAHSRRLSTGMPSQEMLVTQRRSGGGE